MAKKKIILFFGPPGSGKGTQSDLLGAKLKLPVISPGELLRHEREKKTKIGLLVEDKMAKGRLVTDKIVEEIVENRLKKRDCGRGFILDGFPRRPQQLVWLRRKLEKIAGKNGLILAIYIKVSDQEAKSRISGRRVCDCGAAYHLKYNPPKKKGICDLCGRKIDIRPDDKPAIIKDRLASYHQLTQPILDYFRRQGKLAMVDGHGEIGEIEEKIRQLILQL